MTTVEHEIRVREEKPAELDEVGRVLVRAAEIVRAGWCQGALETPDGEHCVLGAVNMATDGATYGQKHPTENKSARDRLRESLGIPDGSLVGWNNHPDRTAEEVAEALERAAYLP